MPDEAVEIELETFDAQTNIIQIQSEVINELIRLLYQRADVDEGDLVHIKKRIDEAATIRAEIEY